MRRSIACGIDIGTHTVRVVVIERDRATSHPIVIGRGQAETSGVRLGYITSIDAVVNSVKEAVSQAENACGVKIKRAYVSVGGIGLSSETSVGSAIISRADKEVTTLDIQKAIAESEESLNLSNKKVIHVVPTHYKLDGKEVHGKPEGMHGVKLEVKTLFVTVLKQHIEDLATAVTEAGIEVLDIVAGIVAESTLILTEKDKIAGCALLNIGAETVNLAVFENNVLISLQVFSIGGMDITKDIALGFKVALDEAEGVKLGSVIGDYPKRKLDEIVDARLGDIFELVENHLKKIKRSGLLPGGVIITGGSSRVSQIEAVAKQYLRLPAHAGMKAEHNAAKYKIRDEAWFTALGLALLANPKISGTDTGMSAGDTIKGMRVFFKNLLSQLLP
jgi:cell division protein FtsA